MPIASAVIIPAGDEDKGPLTARLAGTAGVEVSGVGEKGIAVVLEGEDMEALKGLSETIAGWDGVIDFQLAYFNWEDLDDNDSQ